ncbi:MAG: DUF1080 domain-containing protein, partial [Verrucomicrobiota bacterium]
MIIAARFRGFLSLSFLPLLLAPILAQDKGFQELFNGQDLTGWDGNPKLWTVKDGVIVGKTNSPDDLTYNEFLVWRAGAVSNFDLRATISVKGENNSGIQYRSTSLPDVGKWVLGGYQCDIHPRANYTAMVYEEKGRGIMVQNGQDVVTDPGGAKWLVAERDPVAVDTAQFHEYRILARGNHVQHFIDGQLTASLWDHEAEKRALGGLLGIQIHRGPAMEVHIKSVKLKALPEGKVTPFEKADIPSDAQEIVKPKPRPRPAPPKQA